jgi:hypothetical protein
MDRRLLLFLWEPVVALSRRSVTPGATVLRCFLPPGAHRRPPAQPRVPRAPSSSPAAQRPKVPLRQHLIRAADDCLSTAVFLTVGRPPQ